MFTSVLQSLLKQGFTQPNTHCYGLLHMLQGSSTWILLIAHTIGVESAATSLAAHQHTLKQSEIAHHVKGPFWHPASNLFEKAG